MEHTLVRPEQRLALLTQLDRDGRVVRSLDVHHWPLTLGRALDQHLVLHDDSVAAHHARLAPDASGQLHLHVGACVNGVWLQGQHVKAGASLALPEGPCQLQLGHTQLLLRRPGEVLAPEQPLAHSSGVAGPGAARGGWLGRLMQGYHWVGLLALVWIWMLLQEGLSLDPGAEFTDWLPALMGFPAALIVWSGAWALLSKLFQHRFEFRAHAVIALFGLLLLEVVDLLLAAVGTSLGWPLVWRLRGPVSVILLGWVGFHHLALLMPQQPRRAAWAAALVVLIGGAVTLAETHSNTDRWSEPAFMETLPPSWLNATTSVSVDELVGTLAPLAERLRERAEQAQQEEDLDADGGE